MSAGQNVCVCPCRSACPVTPVDGTGVANKCIFTVNKEKALDFRPISVICYLHFVNGAPQALIGKTVKIRRGPAAVTGDESRNDATVQ